MVSLKLAAGLLISLAVTVTAASAGGPAINNFEPRSLESEPGGLEIESQSDWQFGQPRRKSAVNDDGDSVFDENTVIDQRHSIEFGFGLTSFLRLNVGVEFEKERVDDPASAAEANRFDELKFSEFNPELTAILVPREGDGVGFGGVVEVQRPVDNTEQSTVAIGPIFEYANGPWYVSATPLFVHFFGGEPDDDGSRDNKWDFTYETQLAYQVSSSWTVALEAYGTIDRIGSTGNQSDEARLFGDFNQHRIGPVIYYTFDFGRSLLPLNKAKGDDDDDEAEGSSATVGIGYLAGLNDNTADHTLKLGIEVEF